MFFGISLWEEMNRMSEWIVYFPFSLYKKLTALQIIHNNRSSSNVFVLLGHLWNFANTVKGSKHFEAYLHG